MASSLFFLFAIRSLLMQSVEIPSWNSPTCHVSQNEIISTWGAFLWVHTSCWIALFPFLNHRILNGHAISVPMNTEHHLIMNATSIESAPGIDVDCTLPHFGRQWILNSLPISYYLHQFLAQITVGWLRIVIEYLSFFQLVLVSIDDYGSPLFVRHLYLLQYRWKN